MVWGTPWNVDWLSRMFNRRLNIFCFVIVTRWRKNQRVNPEHHFYDCTKHFNRETKKKMTELISKLLYCTNFEDVMHSEIVEFCQHMRDSFKLRHSLSLYISKIKKSYEQIWIKNWFRSICFVHPRFIQEFLYKIRETLFYSGPSKNKTFIFCRKYDIYEQAL